MKTIGVIGLGSIGMRHAKNLIAMGHTVLGYDPDDKIQAEFYKINCGLRFYDCPKMDGVVIASPTPNHAADIKQALGNKPDRPIFIEKPVADKMIDLGHSNIMVGYNLRFHSCVKEAKEWLDAGLIGKPIWSNFTLGQFNDRPAYLRDGVILNWSHEIDLCLYLLGPASLANSSTRLTEGKDDMTDILLTHENGCRSTVHLDYVTEPEARAFYIRGTKGIIGANLVSRRANLWCEPPTAPFRGEDTWNDNYIEEMQAFIDRIDGKETIGCTGGEGLEVLKICLEVRKQAGLS